MICPIYLCGSFSSTHPTRPARAQPSFDRNPSVTVDRSYAGTLGGVRSKLQLELSIGSPLSSFGHFSGTAKEPACTASGVHDKRLINSPGCTEQRTSSMQVCIVHHTYIQTMHIYRCSSVINHSRPPVSQSTHLANNHHFIMPAYPRYLFSKATWNPY